MFCMACGAEIAGHLTACPNCGQPVRGIEPAGDAEQAAFAATEPPASSSAALGGGGAAALRGPATASAPVTPVTPGMRLPTAPASPSIAYGDISNTLVPRDTAGRVVMATALAMAVDVLAPWVTLGQAHLPLVRIGAPVLLLLAALALPLAALRPTLRRQPIWAALPLTLGAVCLGAGVGIWVLLTWLSPHIVLAVAPYAAPALGSTPLTFTPDVGLYLFLAASVLLILSGYQFFLAARDAQLREAYVVRSPSDIPFPYTLHALQSQGSTAGTGNGAVLPLATGSAVPTRDVAAPAPAPSLTNDLAQVEGDPSPTNPAPASPAASPAPILPGTAAWNQAQDAPTVMRHPTPGAGFPRPLGPRGGR